MKILNLLNENNNLFNYYFFDKNFTNEEIEKIIEITKKYKATDGTVTTHVDQSYRNSKIIWLHLNEETKFIYEKLVNLLKIANKNMWNFTITDLVDSLQFAEYSDISENGKNGFYDWHVDNGSNSMSTRKISVSVQLTEPTEYEGGDLEFMMGRSITKAPKEKGTVIFFPSYILHRVNNVTKGTRKSLVLWFHGPPFV